MGAQRGVFVATKQIVVVLHIDGRLELDAQHFHGKECEQALADLQALFSVQTERKKPEYHKRPAGIVKQGA